MAQRLARETVKIHAPKGLMEVRLFENQILEVVHHCEWHEAVTMNFKRISKEISRISCPCGISVEVTGLFRYDFVRDCREIERLFATAHYEHAADVH